MHPNRNFNVVTRSNFWELVWYVRYGVNIDCVSRCDQLTCSSSPTGSMGRYWSRCRSLFVGVRRERIWWGGCRWLRCTPFILFVIFRLLSWYPRLFLRFLVVRIPVGGGNGEHHSVRLLEQTLRRNVSTSTDCLVSTFVCFEVGYQLFEFWFASFVGYDCFFCEDDCFGPLGRDGGTSVIFSNSSVSFLGSKVCSASI